MQLQQRLFTGEGGGIFEFKAFPQEKIPNCMGMCKKDKNHKPKAI
jgi:hypothetical protein